MAVSLMLKVECERGLCGDKLVNPMIDLLEEGCPQAQVVHYCLAPYTACHCECLEGARTI